MKIAIITGDNFPQPSETFLAQRYKGLVDTGCDITLFGGGGNWNLFPGLKSKLRIRRRRMGSATVLFAFFPCVILLFLRGAKNACGIIRGIYLKAGIKRFAFSLYKVFPFVIHHYDIIHFEYGHNGLQYQDLLELKEIIKSKFIQSFHGADLYFLTLRHGQGVYKNIFEKMDHFHFVSRGLLNYSRSLGYSKDNYKVIPSSADTDFFKPSAKTKNNDSVIIASVGRFHWQKGYEYSLQALKILREKGYKFRFNVVGDGSYKEAILQAIQDFGLSEHVCLLGARNRFEVRKLLDNSDIFIQASIEEGFGNSFLEAGAMELPCVVTAAGGGPEAIIDNETGFIVAKRDPEAMAERIERLINNPGLRREMGQYSRRHICSHYSLKKQIEDNVSMYKSCLGNAVFI